MTTFSCNQLNIPLMDDFHIHLRQGDLMNLVVPTLRSGGWYDEYKSTIVCKCASRRVLVMPNTHPPIKTCKEAHDYQKKLQNLAPDVDFLMTLFLGPWISIEDVQQNAKRCGVQGIKMYPKGVTENSDMGIESYQRYYPLFACLESLGLSLHLHGEMPDASLIKAEEDFLPHLKEIATAFPRLRIVLEHVSSKAGVDMVKSLGPNVAATITVHHIDVVTSDVLSVHYESFAACDNSSPECLANPHLYCKPLPKTTIDREAIRQEIIDGNCKFFLGSDSAPHPKERKENKSSLPPPGVFTSPFIASYLVDAFCRLGCLSNLEQFACRSGAQFFGLDFNDKLCKERLLIKDMPFTLPLSLKDSQTEVVLYRSSETLQRECVVDTV